jgi:hypothetical protein
VQISKNISTQFKTYTDAVKLFLLNSSEFESALFREAGSEPNLLPHQSQNSKLLFAPSGAVATHNGGLEALKKWRAGGL